MFRKTDLPTIMWIFLTQTVCDQYSMIDQSRDKSPLTQKFDIFSLKSIKSTGTLEINSLSKVYRFVV